MRRPGPFAPDRRPLAIPAFRRLWAASVVGAVGGSFSQVLVPTQLFGRTGSSAPVAAAGAVSFVALVASAVASGHAADRVDRRRLLLAAYGGLAACYGSLACLAALPGPPLALLLVLVGGQGLCFGAVLTTLGAVVPRLVPADLLPAANSLSSLVRYGGAVAGPLVAGAVLPVTGFAPLYACDAVALLAVLGAVARLPAMPPAPGRRPGALAGARHLLGSRLLLGVLGVDLAAMVFGMPVAVLPELAERGFGDPAGGGPLLGALYAAYPAGVFALGLLSGTFTFTRRHGRALTGAALVWGGTLVLLAVAPWPAVAVLAFALGGAANCVLSAFRNSFTQSRVDDAVRGRVQGTLTLVLIGGPQLANVAHGLAAAAFGARVAIGLGGLLTVAAVGAIAATVGELRH